MHEVINNSAVAVLAACFVAWGLVSARLGRWNVTGPIAFVLAGVVLTAGDHPVLELQVHSSVVRQLTELTLAIVLFGDAASVSVRRLRSEATLALRLLVIGLPLTIGLGAVTGHVVLGGLGWAVCGVIGAAVAPTDAALGAAIVTDERVPLRIREVLNVESGLNDGIATPFVTFFLAAAVAASAEATGGDTVGGRPVMGLVIGLVFGVAMGWLGGRGLHVARARGWADPAFIPISTGAVALVAYAGAVALDGNGFVAAFVAGIAYGAAQRARAEDVPGHLELTHQGGQVLSLVVWFLFGALLRTAVHEITWREVTFALLALTVLRMLPVALALWRSGFDRETVAVIGWFGPRGLASVVFALLAFETLPAAEGDRVLGAIAITVLASVVLHGLSAAPIAGRWAEDHRAEQPAP